MHIEMNEELQMLFQAVTWVVNYVKKKVHWEEYSLESYVTIWRQNTQHSDITVKHWLSYVKVFYRVFELKEEEAIFLSSSNNIMMQICVSVKILFRNLPIW
jgi:hypothetical protein